MRPASSHCSLVIRPDVSLPTRSSQSGDRHACLDMEVLSALRGSGKVQEGMMRLIT